MEKLKNAYEVLSFVLACHVAMVAAKADNQIDVADLQHLLSPLTKAPAAILDAKKSLEELRTASAEDRAEVFAKLQAEYSIPDGKVERRVEAIIKWVMATGELAGELTA